MTQNSKNAKADQSNSLQRVPLSSLVAIEITEDEILADLIWPAQP